MKNNIYNLISGPFSSERKAFEEWGLHDIYRAGVNEADFYSEIKYPVPEDNCFDRDAVFYVETGKGYGNLIEILKRAKAVNQRGKPVKIKFSEGVLDIVNKDIRYTGKRRGEWTEGGAHYVRNQYGYVDRLHRMENNEFVYVVDQYPFGEDTTVEDIEKYLWTTPDEFDYEDVKRQCDAFQNKAIIVGHEGPFQMGTFMMNMEILFLKMSIEPEVAKRLFDRFVEFELEYYERVLMACDGQIDILRPHDDYGTQISTLFSVGMWNEFFRDNTKKLADLAHKYKAFYQQHSCGRIGSLIPSLIECGVDSLEPIQKVEGLEIDVLKKKYGDKLCFHGGIDTQHLLPRGSVEDVTKEVEYFIKTANVNGGYILMGSQEYQSDIPLENIEAIYRADRN